MSQMLISENYTEVIATGSTRFFYVPEGIFTLSNWHAGTQRVKDSSIKISLIWDQDGDGQNLTYLGTVYTAKGTYKRTVNQTFISNGNSKVIVHRHIFGNHIPREVHVRWNGILTSNASGLTFRESSFCS